MRQVRRMRASVFGRKNVACISGGMQKFGAISICDLVPNIAYFPEISRFFERLSAQVPFQEVLHVAFVPCTYSLCMYPNSHETVNELY